MRAGWRIARANPPLTAIVTLHGLAQLAQGGFVVIFVAFIVDTLGDDGGALGLIRGTMAVGALIGAALIARLAEHVDPPHALRARPPRHGHRLARLLEHADR